LKLSIDLKSLKFRLWLYFALFAALLMLILWFLQIIFLNTYYEDMKIRETQSVAASIVSRYGQDGLFEEIARLTRRNDMYIQIEANIEDTYSVLYSSYNYTEPVNDTDGEATEETRTAPFPIYRKEIQSMRQQLLNGTATYTTATITNPMRDTNMMAYCAYLTRTEGQLVLLYIFSPLYPVESTIEILIDQLKYVTVISLLLAFALSFGISRMVTKPLTNITNSAAELAEGKYGVTFERGHYSEISRLADTLTYTSAELAKADNLQRDLIANVSHDLRTPLTMVKSYAEMIRDLSGDNPEKRNEHLNVIIDEADRLSLLVNDLLELSKMQSGRQELSISSFSLRQTIENLLNSYSLLAEQESLSFDFSADGDGQIIGDEGKIKQVLSNLLNNAIKFSGDSKLIEIALTQKSNLVRCSVTDHGVGIPRKDLKNIWRRYYQASGREAAGGGTGLGLSIVKEILTLHNAHFGVDSEVGRGSTFWFEIRN
jgi:signal transduction histidine kinase